MKCPLCDGKGEYMHQCGGYRPCEHCNGTGEIEVTNDEWRKTCSMEEYATWLWKHFDNGEVIVLWEKYGRPMYKDDNGISRANYTEAMKKWLGEIHNG